MKEFKDCITLNDYWNTVCNEYVRNFAYKHDYFADESDWVGGEPGTVIEIGDMFIGMEEIRYDIDHDIDPEVFEQWYWKHLEHYEMGLHFPNYSSYCKGCPLPYTEQQLDDIRKSQQRVREAREELEKCIKELKGDPSKNLTLNI